MEYTITRYRKRSIFVRHITRQLHEDVCVQPEVSQFYVDHREYKEEMIKAKVIAVKVSIVMAFIFHSSICPRCCLGHSPVLYGLNFPNFM